MTMVRSVHLHMHFLLLFSVWAVVNCAVVIFLSDYYFML